MYTRLNKKFKENQKFKKQDWTERFEIKPIEGYKEHINAVTGEKFPYCCDTHKSLYEKLVEIYEEPHLTHLPEKFINQLAYTEYFIANRIIKEDWYKDITDYIIYNYASFGQPGYGVFDYLKIIIQYLEKTEVDIPIEKRKELIEFIESYVYKEKWPDFGAQFEMLHSTYKRWLKLFPFELTGYFRDLGKHFDKTLPFFYITERDFNPYLKTYNPQIHTKDSLMKYLTELTDEILTKINGVMLLEKGYISNTDLIKLELAINSRKQKLKIGYNNSLLEDESRINQMIEEWFDDEKRFFNEITPLLRKSQPEKTLNELPEKSCRLEQFFEDVSKYKKVMEMLVEQKHIQANTYIWKDEGKGNKGYLAALIKYLHFQGYYKKMYKPNPEQIQQIISNTFNGMTAIDTIKKAKADDYNFAFIPPASTLS